jgi:primary-amine oxidase
MIFPLMVGATFTDCRSLKCSFHMVIHGNLYIAKVLLILEMLVQVSLQTIFSVSKSFFTFLIADFSPIEVGCDCLGSIKYVSGCVISADGTPSPQPNAICVHEQDNGIQWKHTNHRTGKAVVVRKRELVLQTIITVANYEYIFAWIFDQSGVITFHAANRQRHQSTLGDSSRGWSHGSLSSTYFNLRIDPAVGGHKNSLTISDSEALPWDEEQNPYGTGYVTKEEIVRRAGFFDDDVSKNRTFKIVNEGIENRCH